ncbi:MAG TPA: DUF58 domain-containing protein [Clostridiaceae bacterium]
MRILVILLAAFAFFILERFIYGKNFHKGLTFDVRFDSLGVFEGEGAVIIETLINKKLMPVWWCSLQFSVSRFLLFQGEEQKGKVNDYYRRELLTLFSYEKVVKRLNITCSKRGYFKIKELSITSGDLFAKDKFLLNSSSEVEFFVYPSIIDNPTFKLSFERILGDIITKRNLIQDTFQLRGIRDYVPSDSFKGINWKATARTGEMKVNEYEYTSSIEVLFFLNVERYNSWDPENLVEEGIRLINTLALSYMEKGIPVGLLTNGCDILTGEEVYMKPSGGVNQNLLLSQTLAKLDINKVTRPINEVLSQELFKGRKEAVMIMVSHFHPKDLVTNIEEAQVKGYDIKWIIPKKAKEELSISSIKDLYVWEVEN